MCIYNTCIHTQALHMYYMYSSASPERAPANLFACTLADFGANMCAKDSVDRLGRHTEAVHARQELCVVCAASLPAYMCACMYACDQCVHVEMHMCIMYIP